MQRSLTLPVLTGMLLLGAHALAQVGANDPDFNPGSGTNGDVLSITTQPDGKIIIGGWFMDYDSIERETVERINADGSPDSTFYPGTVTYGYVDGSALQPDGKIMIVGGFADYNGEGAKRVVRLNADGSFDASFETGGDTNDGISAVAVQPDGKVLIAGPFYMYDDVPVTRIARLNTDGSLDTGFDPGSGANGVINAIALGPDGKIIIVGGFSTVDGISRHRIARLNADGSLDTSFDPGTGVENAVYSTALTADGKILIGGTFHAYDGHWVVNIIQVNPDGSLDTGFDPGLGAASTVYAIKVLPDGKILIGGDFTSYNGIDRGRIARLNADGSLDSGFDPGAGADNTVNSIAVLPNGKVVIGGAFTHCDGAERAHIAVLQANGAAGMEELKTAHPSALHLWPNPNNGDRLFFTLDGLGHSLRNVDALLLDATGREVLSGELHPAGGSLQASLDLGRTANGVYLLQVSAGEQVFSSRVVVGR